MYRGDGGGNNNQYCPGEEGGGNNNQYCPGEEGEGGGNNNQGNK